MTIEDKKDTEMYSSNSALFLGLRIYGQQLGVLVGQCNVGKEIRKF